MVWRSGFVAKGSSIKPPIHPAQFFSSKPRRSFQSFILQVYSPTPNPLFILARIPSKMGWFTPSSSASSWHGSSHHSSSSRHHHRPQQHHVHYTSSSSRRRPRDGYINRIVHQLRRLLRQLMAYARRHPVKLFVMVVMPLITGGALGKVLRQFGIRIPAGLGRMGGSMSSSPLSIYYFRQLLSILEYEHHDSNSPDKAVNVDTRRFGSEEFWFGGVAS